MVGLYSAFVDIVKIIVPTVFSYSLRGQILARILHGLYLVGIGLIVTAGLVYTWLAVLISNDCSHFSHAAMRPST